MGKKHKKKSPPLSSMVEKQIDRDRPAIEVINDDIGESELLEFTRAFLEDFQQIPMLPKLDLSTPEEARKAAMMLEARKEALDQKLKTVGLLKKLLEKRRPDGFYN